jgi:hypothetical protein
MASSRESWMCQGLLHLPSPIAVNKGLTNQKLMTNSSVHRQFLSACPASQSRLSERTLYPVLICNPPTTTKPNILLKLSFVVLVLRFAYLLTKTLFAVGNLLVFRDRFQNVISIFEKPAVPKKGCECSWQHRYCLALQEERLMSKEAKCLFLDNYEEYVLRECGVTYSDTNLSKVK